MRAATAVAIIYAFVRSFLEVLQWWGVDWSATAVPLVDVFFLVLLLFFLNRQVEADVSALGFAGWYNVVVVSWIAAIPQTVVAVVYAREGYYYAAYIDSMVSTLVDAFLVTAIARYHALREMRNYAPLIAVWVALTLAFGATVEYTAHAHVSWLWFWLGALILPTAFAPRGAAASISLGSLLDLLFSTAAMGWIALDIGHALVKLHELGEGVMGVLGAAVATAPDFITALTIRLVLSKNIGALAGDDVMIRTMLAAAVHDQISIPALVTIIAPTAYAQFPHALNIAVSLLKFTLLSPRLFWLVGIPSAVALIILSAAHAL